MTERTPSRNDEGIVVTRKLKERAFEWLRNEALYGTEQRYAAVLLQEIFRLNKATTPLSESVPNVMEGWHMVLKRDLQFIADQCEARGMTETCQQIRTMLNYPQPVAR